MTPPVLGNDDDLAPHVGTIVTLRGVVTRTKIPTLCGVDVADCALSGPVEATGRLESSTVTTADLSDLIARVGQVAHRGPGTTYRLVALDRSGLARPHA